MRPSRPADREFHHWTLARWLLVPTDAIFQRQLAEIAQFAGTEARAAALLRLSVRTVRNLLAGKTPSMPSRSLVWLTWALLLHPEQAQTVFDLVCWGRFRYPRAAKRKPIPFCREEEYSGRWLEWSDWVI